MIAIDSFSPFLKAYFITLVGVIGLVFGSFLNVVALRLLSGESIVFPGSKCPKCQNHIAWYDNLPVLSYLLLMGKCRHCKTHISVQYPIVEAFTALSFIGVFIFYGFSLKTLFLFVLCFALIVITITDLKEKSIFDITSIPLIPLGLLYNFFDIGNTHSQVVHIPLMGINYTLSLNEVFISAIVGAIIGAAFFEIFSRLGLLLVGQYAFGGGDTVIGAALGAWFGWKMIIVILALSFVFQLIVGIPVILMNMYKDKDYKSIIFTIIMVSSIFIPKIGQYFGFTNNLAGALFILILAFSFAISGMFVILSRARERQSFTFLPFGPALVFGGFIVMFWGPALTHIIGYQFLQ